MRHPLTARAAATARAVACLFLFFAATAPAAAVTHHVAPGQNIQQAINNASAGDTVALGAGVHTLSAQLVAKSGVTLAGAGAGATTIKFSGGTADRFLHIDGADDVSVNGLTLDGDGSAASYGVVVANAQRVQVRNVTIRKLGGNAFGPIGVYLSSNVSDAAIEDSTFEHIGENSFWGSGVRVKGSTRTLIAGNTIAHTGRGGILANDHATFLTIRNNTVRDIGLANPTNPDNAGEATPRLGIEVWNQCHDSIIEDNTVDHYISVDRSSRVAVRRNTIGRAAATTAAFAGLELVSSNETTVSDVVFTGNTFVAPAAAGTRNHDLGASISGGGVARHVLFDGNTIDSPGTWGVQLQAGDGGLAGNLKERFYFLANTLARTRDGDPGPYGQYGDQGAALRLNADHGHLADLAIVDNDIIDNAGVALELLNAGRISDVRFADNTATGNKTDGPLSDIGTLPTLALNVTAPAAFLHGQPTPLSVAFADGRPVNHALWDLGFGLPLTGASIEPTFAPSGTPYAVTVIAWDADGNAAHARLHLHAPEPGAAGVFGAAVFATTCRRSSHRRRR